MSAARLTDCDQLVAGLLYCLVRREFDYERDDEYEAFGALVYWDGYDFVHEDGDVCNDDWDSVVAQSDKPDPRYISEPQKVFADGRWMDRREWSRLAIAQWRAECATRGVVIP